MSQVTRTTRTATANRRARSNAASSENVPARLIIPEHPPRVPRRPPSKGNKRETLADIAKRIPIDIMRTYFNYPLRTAAEAMHISVTTLKRLCRRHGVKRWPHRQISGINRALSDLEAQHQAASASEREAVTDQLRQLHRRREVIIELAFESDEESGRKSFGLEAAGVVAHKRNGRSNGGSDGNSSPSSSTTSSTRVRTPPAPESPTIMPDSPRSAESLDEVKTTTVWWQHGPSDETEVDPISCPPDGFLGPPASVIPCPPARRVGQRSKSSTILGGSLGRVGGIGIKSASTSSIGQSRQHDSARALSAGRGSSPATSASHLDLSMIKCPDEIQGDAARRFENPSSLGAVAGGRARIGAVGGTVRDRTSVVATIRETISGNEEPTDEIQFASLGDLLFDTDDAPSEHRNNFDSGRSLGSLSACPSGIAARGATLGNTWSHTALGSPLSQGMFPHENGLVGSPSFPQDNLFMPGGSLATSWASVGSERGAWSSSPISFP